MHGRREHRRSGSAVPLRDETERNFPVMTNNDLTIVEQALFCRICVFVHHTVVDKDQKRAIAGLWQWRNKLIWPTQNEAEIEMKYAPSTVPENLPNGSP